MHLGAIIPVQLDTRKRERRVDLTDLGLDHTYELHLHLGVVTAVWRACPSPRRTDGFAQDGVVMAEDDLPGITAHVDVGNAWLGAHPEIEAGTNGLHDPANQSLSGGRGPEGSATFDWRGIQITTGVMPYRFWLLQRLQDDLAAAGVGDQEHARSAFGAGCLEPILDLRTMRRVERMDHLEVWGPLI